ncbi:MAG: hypothetical protein CMF57_07125 [Leifsonia sp.]|nr:hypothetical protein [Leifsonia sp.]
MSPVTGIRSAVGARWVRDARRTTAEGPIMTEHRHLKRLVRERMQRTGEAYTTALRHVLSARDDASTDTVTDSRPRPAPAAPQHRVSALARTMLAAAGLPVSEPMACGLGGGIGFLYAIFQYKQVEHPMLTIVAQHHPQPWLEAVTAHLNAASPAVEHRIVTSSSAKAAFDKLDATLETSPAWITVGRGGLPWHEIPEGPLGAAEAADPYPVVVTRGPEAGAYLIDDADGEMHTLSADELATAWALHKKGRFAIETLAPLSADTGVGADPADGGGFHSEVVEASPTPDAVRASVATTVAHLTGPVIHHAFDSNFGLSGMRKLATELRDDRTKAGWRRRFGDARSFEVGMLRLAECLTWVHTAPGGTRPLFAEFLREAAELLPAAERESWREAAREADAAGECWARVADTAAAGSTGNTDSTDKEATFDEFADLVEQAIAHEERMVVQLSR